MKLRFLIRFFIAFALVACHKDNSDEPVKSWISLNEGLPKGMGGYSLAIKNTTIFLGGNLGVYQSDDSGKTWTQTNNGIGALPVFAMINVGKYIIASAVSPDQARASSGIFRLEEGLTHWDSVGYFNDVFYLGTSGADVFALDGGSDTEIIVSHDSATTWSAFAALNVKAICGNGSALIAAGVDLFLTTDNGKHWSQNLNVTGQTSAVATEGQTLIVGGDEGIFISNDNGTTWKLLDADLKNHNIKTIAINSGRIFVGTYEGQVLNSSNGGQSWTQIGNNMSGPVQSIGFIGEEIFVVDGTGIYTNSL